MSTDKRALCAERWSGGMPFTSDHLWASDFHHQPYGPCLKCGKDYRTWAGETLEAAKKLNFGFTATSAPPPSPETPASEEAIKALKAQIAAKDSNHA